MRKIAKEILLRLHLLEPARRARRFLYVYSGLRRLHCEWHTIRQNKLTEPEIEAIYDALYHGKSGYGSSHIPEGSGWRSDEDVKRAHAKALLEAWPMKKILVGGCSTGMGVLALRELGADAWGFDIAPDLDDIVRSEVRAYVRRGTMTRMPFGPEDAFEALVTTDVLEHVQVRHLGEMFAELRRLGFRRMAHLINHTQISPDHMTLKPISWWERRMRAHGFALRKDIRTKVSDDKRIYGLNGDPEHVYTFWERDFTNHTDGL